MNDQQEKVEKKQEERANPKTPETKKTRPPVTSMEMSVPRKAKREMLPRL